MLIWGRPVTALVGHNLPPLYFTARFDRLTSINENQPAWPEHPEKLLNLKTLKICKYYKIPYISTIGPTYSHFSYSLLSILASHDLNRYQKSTYGPMQWINEDGSKAPCIGIFDTRPMWVASYMPWPLYPGEKAKRPVHIGQEAGWAPHLVCREVNPDHCSSSLWSVTILSELSQ
jgi:hypothetical protein